MAHVLLALWNLNVFDENTILRCHCQRRDYRGVSYDTQDDFYPVGINHESQEPHILAKSFRRGHPRLKAMWNLDGLPVCSISTGTAPTNIPVKNADVKEKASCKQIQKAINIQYLGMRYV